MHLPKMVLAALVLATVASAQGPVTTLAAADAPFQVSYAANLQIGESYINFVNDGANGAPLLGPGLGGAVGNVCVNVYAFDPTEEMISCCSCLVTPDQTKTLGVVRDILSNTATGVKPSSVTIILVSTLAGTGGTGTSCTNSAATINTATIVPGVTAWRTTLHAAPTSPGGYATTEGELARLSASPSSDLIDNTLTSRCANIIGNLSGFGICASCRLGALGASKH
jgi:hypothetical protein